MHLTQTTQGAAKGKTKVALGIERLKGHRGLDIQWYATVVALVDQGNEAPHCIVVARQRRQLPIPGVDPFGAILGATGDASFTLLATQARNLTKQDCREALAQFHEVGSRQWLLAQIVETAPERRRALTEGHHAAMGQLHWFTANDLPLAQAGEQLAQSLRLPHPITLNLGTRMQAMILLAVHRHHLHMRLERGDRRQKALAVVAIGIELIGRLVGGRYQHHALLHHQAEQAAEQHGITDVADEQLVEAQHTHLAPQLLDQQTQRVGIAGQLELAAMHPLHEMMEMLPPRRYPQSVVEAVHQPGLAAPDRPPEVHAERALAAMHSLMTVLQRLDRTALRSIGDKTTR